MRNPLPQAQQVVTSFEAAHALNANVNSVKNWIAAGHLPSYKTPGGHNRIRVADLREFMAKRGIPDPWEENGQGLYVLSVFVGEEEMRYGFETEAAAIAARRAVDGTVARIAGAKVRTDVLPGGAE